MVELGDIPGGALVESDAELTRVLLWGVPATPDYEAVLRAVASAPPGLPVELDLHGLTADPDEAASLVDRLRAEGHLVAVEAAPGGRVERALARRRSPLRLV